jgi:hypothetical protein
VEARVGHAAYVDAAHPAASAARTIVPSRDHHGLAHASGREAIQQPERQAAPGDLDQTPSVPPDVPRGLADAGGGDDAMRATPAPPSAARKRVKSPREAPIFATRTHSQANAPWLQNGEAARLQGTYSEA